MLMKKRGLSLKMPSSEDEEREVVRMRQSLQVKDLMTIEGRLGILLDSTSGDQKNYKDY